MLQTQEMLVDGVKFSLNGHLYSMITIAVELIQAVMTVKHLLELGNSKPPPLRT